MPEMIPVGQNAYVPNATAGMDTLSSILGVQQKRIAVQQAQQNLQTGQYTQQSAAATASQDQQKNAELQALSKFTSAAVQDPSYRNPDGTVNVDKFQRGAMSAAPTYGQAYLGNATTNFKEATANRQALLNLDADKQKLVAQNLGALAAKPDASPDDLKSTIKTLRGISPDQDYQDMIDNNLRLFPDTSKMSDAQATSAIRNHAQMVAQGMGAAASNTTSNIASYTTPKGGVGLIQTNPNSPLGVGAIGTDVRQGLGPTDQPAYKAEVAAQTAARGGLGTGAAGDVNQHYANMQAEAQKAETFTGIARNVQDFAHTAITGTPAEKLNLLNGMLAFAGVPPSQDVKTASDLLEKNMSQLNLQGNVATDFKAMVTQMAQPHMSMSEDAIKQAAGQLIGQAQMKKSIGTAMTPEYNHAQATGDTSLYRAKRDAITNIADPRVWEFNSLSPKDQKAFRSRLSPQDDAALGAKYKAANALGLLPQ